MNFDESLGRSVMELSTDSSKWISDLAKDERALEHLGQTAKEVEQQVKSFARGVQESGQQSAASADLIGRAFTKAEQGIDGLVQATRELAGADVITKANNYVQVIEQLGGVTKLTAVEQAKVTTVVGQAIAKYQALGQTAPKELQDIFNATQKVIGPTSALDVHIQQIQRHVAAFSGDQVIQEAHQMAAAVEQVGGASKLTAAEQAKVNAAVTDAIAKYHALGQQAPASLQKLQRETEQTRTLSERLGATFKSSFAQMVGAFSLVSVIQSATSALIAFGKEAIESAGAIVDLSNKTGLSFKTIQQFQFVAGQSGVSVDALTNSVFKLTTNLADGKKSARQAVADLGLEFDALRAGNPDEAFNEIVAALERMPPSFERNLAMQRLFGKGAQEVSKLVRDGYTSMARAAEISSDDQIRALDRAADKWDAWFANRKRGLRSWLGNLVEAWEGPQGEAMQRRLRTSNDVMSIEEFRELGIGSQPADLIAAYRKQLQDLRADLESLTPAQRAVIAEAVKLGQSAKEIADAIGLSEDAVSNFIERMKDTEQQGKRLNAWLTSFRDNARDLEAQLSQAGSAFKSGIPLEILEEYESQIKKVVTLSPALGEAIGAATIDATNQLRAGQLKRAIKELGNDFAGLFEKFRGKAADIQPLTQSVDQAVASIRKTVGAVEPEAVQLQARLVALQKDSLQKRLSMIDLEYQAQVAALRKEQIARRAAGDANEGDYQDHLTVLAAERQKALADATLDWEEHALSIGDVFTKLFEELPQIVASGLQRGGWTAVGASIGQFIGEGLAAHFLDELKNNPAISPAELKRMQKAVGIGTAAGSAGGGVIGGSQGAQVGGIASAAGGLALAGTAWGAAASVAALAAATAGIGVAAAAIMVGIKKILKNNAEWNKLAKGIGRDLGVNISEALAKQMEADSKKFGRSAAVLLHLDEIIDEAGGVKDFGIDKAIAKTRDLFVLLGRGELTAKQVGETFNTLFAKILPDAISKTTGLVSRNFRELIDLARANKIESEALTEFVTSQTMNAAAGLQQFFQNATLKTQAGAEAAGAALAGAFGALRESLSTREALAQLQPMIAALQEQLAKTGFTGGAAFEEIARLAGIAADTIAGPALNAINGLSSALVGASNAGFITQEIFTGLTGEIMANRQAILDQGHTAEDVNRLIQQDLQRIWELQQDNNFAVDEQTQLLLDQAEAQGLVGDQFRSAEQRMVRALESIAKSMKILTGETDKFVDSINRIPDNKRVDIDVVYNDKYRDGGPPIDPNDPSSWVFQDPEVTHMGGAFARGGIVGMRRATAARILRFPKPPAPDTMWAGVSPGELLLNVSQQENAARVVRAASAVVQGVAMPSAGASALPLAATGTEGRSGRPVNVTFAPVIQISAVDAAGVDRLVKSRSFGDSFKQVLINDINSLRTEIERVTA
jgi:predicted transcriptional regulator